MQVLVLASQAGVLSLHWLKLADEHWTHAPLAVSHTGAVPPHCASLVQGNPHRPLAREQIGATAGQACVAAPP